MSIKPKDFPDPAQQQMDIDRLGDHRIHSRFDTLIVLRLGRVSGEGNDGYAWAAADHGSAKFRLADDTGGFEPVHFGHLNIHQDEVKLAVNKLSDCFVPVYRQRDAPPLTPQDAAGHFLIDDVILSHHNIQEGERDQNGGRWFGRGNVRSALVAWRR